MKQFYSGMADFLQTMVDQELKQCGEYQYPTSLPTEHDKEIYHNAHKNGFINAMFCVNEWLEIAIKPVEK